MAQPGGSIAARHDMAAGGALRAALATRLVVATRPLVMTRPSLRGTGCLQHVGRCCWQIPTVGALGSGALPLDPRCRHVGQAGEERSGWHPGPPAQCPRFPAGTLLAARSPPACTLLLNRMTGITIPTGSAHSVLVFYVGINKSEGHGGGWE